MTPYNKTTQAVHVQPASFYQTCPAIKLPLPVYITP